MTMRRGITVLFVLSAVAAVAVCAARTPAEPAVRRQADFLIMSTEARVVVYADTAAHGDQALAAALDRLLAIQKALNRYSADSEISALKAAAGQQAVVIAESTARAIADGRRWWRETGGTFNPLVGSLVEVWKRAEKADRLPGDDELRQAMSLLDMNEIKLAEAAGRWTCRLPRAGMQLDLGGLAKGWAADEALTEIRRRPGIRSALVVIGGDGACWSEATWSRPWRFAVQDPLHADQTAAYAELELTNEVVVTSGNYYRSYTIGGRKYHHILDPRTGRPVENAMVSVTVIHRDGAAADALATACVVLGTDEALALLERLPEAEGLILELRQGSLAARQTSGFARYVVPAGSGR